VIWAGYERVRFHESGNTYKHLNKCIMSKVSYYTEEGLKVKRRTTALKDERPLQHLSDREARDKKFSENAEI
jgi:hypothetical protein